jgi:predicted nucleic acid-binding protein
VTVDERELLAERFEEWRTLCRSRRERSRLRFRRVRWKKRVAAEQLVATLWETGAGCLSVHVLQEFFVAMTRKVARPLSADEAADRIREFTTWKVFAATAEDVLAAMALHKQAKVSFWDAMVVQAALRNPDVTRFGPRI